MNRAIEADQDLLESVATQYRADGYDVVSEPSPSLIPFDLEGYRPDLLARKSDSDSILVEVRGKGQRTSFEQLRTIVEKTKRHEGWRFVLVTGNDALGAELQETPDRLSWEEIEQGLDESARLDTMGAREAAYLVLWIAFERSLRKLSREANIPLDRLAPSGMIRQLYSQGELTMAEFDDALYCLELRNRVAHGFQAPNIAEGYGRLRELLKELLSQRPGSTFRVDAGHLEQGFQPEESPA